MALSNYPLSWPEGWKRTPPSQQKNGHFGKNETVTSTVNPQRKKGLSIIDGINRILIELSRMNVRRDDILISTNVPTRLDGLPRSDQRKPTDPGVAVYWRKNLKAPMQCIAIDIYTEVADNLAAVAATLEALRAIERHGGAQVQERSFRGFAALPESTSPKLNWRDVLGWKDWNCLPSRDAIDSLYRERALKDHPDRGGSHEAMAELNIAREEALREIAGQQ